MGQRSNFAAKMDVRVMQRKEGSVKGMEHTKASPEEVHETVPPLPPLPAVELIDEAFVHTTTPRE